MDPFPPNVRRLAAAPFSLDAARRRHVPDAGLEDPTLATPDRVPQLAAPTGPGRRRPWLELVAGSAVPDATPAQVTDARDRFLGRLRHDAAGAPGPLPTPAGAAAQPSMALMRRIPRMLPWHDDGPGCA